MGRDQPLVVRPPKRDRGLALHAVALFERARDAQRVAEDADVLEIGNERVPSVERQQRARVLEAPHGLPGVVGEQPAGALVVVVTPPDIGRRRLPRSAARPQDVLVQATDLGALAVALRVVRVARAHVTEEQAVLLQRSRKRAGPTAVHAEHGDDAPRTGARSDRLCHTDGASWPQRPSPGCRRDGASAPRARSPSRWICDVPSYSCMIFASRISFSTGYSLMKPYPP